MDSKFNRKGRLVVGVHNTASPLYNTYSSVMTRASVRLAFIIPGLNNIDICACHIGNAYLNAPCREKLWTKA